MPMRKARVMPREDTAEVEYFQRLRMRGDVRLVKIGSHAPPERLKITNDSARCVSGMISARVLKNKRSGGR